MLLSVSSSIITSWYSRRTVILTHCVNSFRWLNYRVQTSHSITIVLYCRYDKVGWELKNHPTLSPNKNDALFRCHTTTMTNKWMTSGASRLKANLNRSFGARRNQKQKAAATTTTSASCHPLVVAKKRHIPGVFATSTKRSAVASSSSPLLSRKRMYRGRGKCCFCLLLGCFALLCLCSDCWLSEEVRQASSYSGDKSKHVKDILSIPPLLRTNEFIRGS